MTRRGFLTAGGGVVAAACGGATTMAVGAGAGSGRLRARPKKGNGPASLSPGEHALDLGGARDGLLIVPPDLPPEAALVVLLHGANGSARGITSRIEAAVLAGRFHAIVLVPESRGRTWDAIRGEFGPDVTFLDAALTRTFEGARIDRKHVAMAGFSDGASYALSLGLINGDLFTHVMAFSPGFLVEGDAYGKPAIFVSHGTRDEILPIDRTSRRLVPQLRDAGYAVDYREFDGPHTAPAAMVETAFTWMAPRP